MNASVGKEGEAQLGFGWWTFSGWTTLILGTLLCLAQWQDLGGLAWLLALASVVLGAMIITFSRTAFIIATILSINPILWVINGIYIRNRWNDPRVMENRSAAGTEPGRETTDQVERFEQVKGALERTPVAGAPLPLTRNLPVKATKGATPTVSLIEQAEEDMWAAALAEENSPNRRQGLWAKCFSESGGVESAAKAAYMATRVSEMKVEARAARQAAEDRRRDEEERQRKSVELERRVKTHGYYDDAVALAVKSGCSVTEVGGGLLSSSEIAVRLPNGEELRLKGGAEFVSWVRKYLCD